MDKIIAILGMIIVSFIGSLGVLFLKLGVNKFNTGKSFLKTIKEFFRLEIIGGVFFYVLGVLVFIWILKSQDLSYLYPLTALAQFFIVFFSVKFLHEKMNKYKWAGMLLIVAGAIIISL